MESELAVVEFPFCGQLAASLKPKERIVSISMTEVTTLLALDVSYRHASNIANRVYHRDGDDLFIPETLKARQIKMGKAASSDYMSEACEILESHGIDRDKESSTTLPMFPNPSGGLTILMRSASS